jgi:hypothetical protein
MNTTALPTSSGAVVVEPAGPMKERGFRIRGPVDDEWGRSESVDPDNVGDIADEGAGHRG